MEKPGFCWNISVHTSVQSWLVWLVPCGVRGGSVGLGGLGMLAANELAIAGKVGWVRGWGWWDGGGGGGGCEAICVPSRLGLSFLYLEAVPPFLLETRIAPARKLSQKEIGQFYVLLASGGGISVDFNINFTSHNILS